MHFYNLTASRQLVFSHVAAMLDREVDGCFIPSLVAHRPPDGKRNTICLNDLRPEGSRLHKWLIFLSWQCLGA